MNFVKFFELKLIQKMCFPQQNQMEFHSNPFAGYLSVDPYYLTYKAKVGVDPKIILAGRTTNNEMSMTGKLCRSMAENKTRPTKYLHIRRYI